MISGGDEVPVAVSQPGVVADVPSRLLQVGGQPAPFQDLGQEVGGLLTGEMGAPELGDGVVSVVEEDPLIELLGLAGCHERVVVETTGHRVDAGVRIRHELVEEEPSQRLGRPRITGEERALHHLREIDQPEHRQVEIGEESTQDRLLVGGELLLVVRRHGSAIVCLETGRTRLPF